eukprot:scaffold42729_cov66-Phaeocystis_antarctica.AAC.2
MPGRRPARAQRRCNRIWQSPNKPGLEAGGLAFGEDLGGHAASQNKQSKYARRHHEEEQLIEEGAELQTAQWQAKRVDAEVEDVKNVEQCGDGGWHCDLEDALDARRNLRSTGGEGDQRKLCRVTARVHRRSVLHLVEGDHLFERRANLR